MGPAVTATQSGVGPNMQVEYYETPEEQEEVKINGPIRGMDPSER